MIFILVVCVFIASLHQCPHKSLRMVIVADDEDGNMEIALEVIEGLHSVSISEEVIDSQISSLDLPLFL